MAPVENNVRILSKEHSPANKPIETRLIPKSKTTTHGNPLIPRAVNL